LEQEINSDIKVITKPNETDYEMPCTTGIRGRRKLTFEESSERSNAENQRKFEKFLALLN
jgi:hypothetical protein